MMLTVSLRQQRITQCIWLRAFGAPSKSAFGGLRIRSERYLKLQATARDVKNITHVK